MEEFPNELWRHERLLEILVFMAYFSLRKMKEWGRKQSFPVEGNVTLIYRAKSGSGSSKSCPLFVHCATGR